MISPTIGQLIPDHAGAPVDLSQNVGLETLHLFVFAEFHTTFSPLLGGEQCECTLLPILASLNRATRLRRLRITIDVCCTDINVVTTRGAEGSITRINPYKGYMNWLSLNRLATYEQYGELQEVFVTVE